MMTTRRLTLGALILVTAQIAAAQQPASPSSQSRHQLAGAWRIIYPVDLRVQNGVLDPIMATGTLTVEEVGDSLIGRLVTDPYADQPGRPPQRLAAGRAAGDVVFVTRSEVTVNMGGRERTLTTVTTWILGVKGDSLAATVERRLEGMNARNHGPQPVTGIRRKE